MTKRNFWSRRWATMRSFIKKLFWVIIALFNLVMALFFIRVNIAKLVRGAIIESNDLTLILQAKEAIEETATYLKEYLIPPTRSTDGTKFMSPSDVFTPFWHRFTNRPTRTRRRAKTSFRATLILTAGRNTL